MLLWMTVPFPTIQSEKWLIHAKVREPHLNPPVRLNSLPLALFSSRVEPVKFIRTGGIQMWFAILHVNQPCFGLDCGGRY